MDDNTKTGTAFELHRFPVPVACPLCRARLEAGDGCLTCPPCIRADCPGRFEVRDGFPDLVLGARFDDDSDEEIRRFEQVATAHTVLHYWIPLFRRSFRTDGRAPLLLALGCGTGVEVDELCRAGFDCVGIDNAVNRVTVWHNRDSRDRLLLANGMHLPFEDGTFDGVFCGCVFPHVGVKGDSNVVADNFEDDRLALAREMARILRRGGRAFVSSPNRYFIFDIFHGRQPGSYKPRFNPPTSRFLLSVGDYRRLFKASGCRKVEPLPVRNYWGFTRSRNDLTGFLLSMPVRLAFWLTSVPTLSFLRPSPISPWLVVSITK
jgi:SAM-dependent methyltransferase